MDKHPEGAVAAGDPELAPFSILIVDDEAGICDFLCRALSRHYAQVAIARSSEEAEQLRRRRHFDLLIVDICMPGQSGIDWARALDEQGVGSELIFMTGFAELDNALQAVRLGASDFILKPFRLEQMLAAVRRCFERLQLARENYIYRRRLPQLADQRMMIGESPQIGQLRELVARVAPTRSAVLIEGETGTGKELVAAALHQLSGRKGPFVPLNCGAVAAELIESELFGHTKGAFTGAGQPRQGLFSYADGGTLFLDELAEMPLLMQAKLLRVLEEGKIRPVGSEQARTVDVRIVAASNRSLQQAVEQGEFRADLFYRLNVLPLQLPPLRQRCEDIAPLAQYLGGQLAQELGLPPLPLSQPDIQALQQYHWPGNVRELRNLLERCMLLGSLPHQMLSPQADSRSTAEPRSGYPPDWSLSQVERHHIERVLARQQGNKSRAAEQLGIGRKTLDRKLQRRSDG
ncbi:sigma-54-dependent transcriptional regulator [Marinobacterium arenosum]|uniref:sigma-54-dependent transcriptional regulator n=1 Tax=Marinobacterium arenosum TaxID=2862496 RepID=UPI001C938E51|nr:sigma-54 dependent transcriptional regulator [Marinobacterium arenosum]MBY4675618.1 sigma-54 dependent transcriptional regulator [Marinobacterium arenosum]